MESIVSIISVCVTLLLGVAGLIFNSYVQRKTHSISVITKTRLARREKTKEAEDEAGSDPLYSGSGWDTLWSEIHRLYP